jgi:ParB/RepB/Spo0J family partition protein
MKSGVQTSAVYQVIALEKLEESPLNPRKAFDADALRDLSESLKAKGCIEPIVVRSLNGSGRFEVVAGARRFRAAKLAGLDDLPAIVRDYTDAEVLEVQVVENLQRADVNPIEEADGYQKLIELAGYVRDSQQGKKVPDVARIAGKIGKSPRYVYDRLTLVQKLIPEARAAGGAGWITASHLVELARLTPKDQGKALAAVLSDTTYAVASLEDVLKDWNTPVDQMDSGVENRAMSVRALQEYIEENIHKGLIDATFDVRSSSLCPEVGSCAECMKRSDSELGELPEITEKTKCLDPECFEDKLKKHVAYKELEIRAETGKAPVKFDSRGGRVSGGVPTWRMKDAKAGEKGAVPALDVSTGDTKWVKIAEAAKLETSEESTYKRPTEAEEKEAKEKAEEQAAAEMAQREKLLTELVERVKGPITCDELKMIYRFGFNGSDEERISKFVRLLPSEETSMDDVRKAILVASVLRDGFSVDYWEFLNGQEPESCQALDQWAELLKAEPVPEPKTMSGLEIKKKAKAGAKAMKVKIGKRKGGKKSKR